MLRTLVFNYIECHYNRWCCHSYCDSLSPEIQASKQAHSRVTEQFNIKQSQ
ncbi:hypothetical protein [Serratia fonticola]